MRAEPSPRPGMRFWIVLAVVLLMAANIAVHGWDCWGRRPGGSTSAGLYVAVLLLSLPSLGGMFRISREIIDRCLGCCLMYLGVLLDVGHLGLNVVFGPYIFSSAHGGILFYSATFLSCVIVAIMPDMVRMAFSSR